MRALLLCIALIIMSALPALAVDVLIVQSTNGPAYAESIRGFKETYKGSTQTILLSDYAEVDLIRLVKEEQPRLVLAVGDPALEKAKKVRQVPVVALMALSFNLNRLPASNIHGVSVVASPDRYMQLFADMGVKQVGVVFDPSRTGHYVQHAKQAAARSGIQLSAYEVRSPAEVVGAIEKMTGTVDALWMLPDTTAVTSVTLEAYFSFSIKNQKPVVTFSQQYLSKGASVSLDIDRSDMGRQAGDLTLRILAGDARSTGISFDPRNVKRNENREILIKIGRQQPTSLLSPPPPQQQTLAKPAAT